MKVSDYPEELVKKRQAIECNFIFTLYKIPDIIEDYKNIVNGTDIITDDGIFYYGLALGLRKAGYQAFDNISIYTYLEGQERLKKGFESRGGYSSVAEIMSLLNEENIDSYYDELIKNNMLLRLYDSGFDVMKNIDKFNQMSAEDVYDFYDYKLNDVCVNKIEKIKTEDLSNGYDEYINEWDSGSQVGFKIGYPLLNYRLAGVHKDNFLLHLASIGNGKTTTAILFYLLPVIESGENVLVIANEQNISEWRQMVLASVLFNKIGYFGMNRQRFTLGHFTSEQKAKLKEASAWLANQKGKIAFVELQTYDFNSIKKVMKKYSKLGFSMCLLDTLKPMVESNDRAWAEFSEVAKELFITAKTQHIAVVATAQLSSDAMSRRYLDLSCIGKSRAIAETATQVTMFRSLTSEEKEKIEPWQFQKDENGKYSKVRKTIPLDPEKDYIVLFTPKNRFGDTQPQIVYERNMSFNTLKEIGYTEIPYDGFSKR